MKRERKKRQDLNILSAYLDDDLSKSSKQALEKRLNREPALRETLAQLSATKILLGRLPRQQAPRNFTLTPDMVKVRQKAQKPLFTYLKLATSLAAVLLVVLVGFEFLVIDKLQGRLAMAPDVVMEMVPEAVMEVEIYTDESTPEPLILWADPPPGLGQADPDFDAFGEPVVELEVAPLDLDPQEEPALEEEETLSDETLSDETLSVPKEKAETRPKQDMLILGINSDQAGEIIERSIPAAYYVDEIPQSQPGTLRIMQYAFAFIFIISGLTLAVLYRWR